MKKFIAIMMVTVMVTIGMGFPVRNALASTNEIESDNAIQKWVIKKGLDRFEELVHDRCENTTVERQWVYRQGASDKFIWIVSVHDLTTDEFESGSESGWTVLGFAIVACSDIDTFK